MGQPGHDRNWAGIKIFEAGILQTVSKADDYIYQQEAKMAYKYLLLVETLNMDVSSMLSDLNGDLTESGQDQVEVIGFLKKLFAILDTNNLELLKEYLDRDENDIAQYGTVEYVYNVQPQIYVEYDQSFRRVCPDSTLDSLGIPASTIDTSLISSSVSTNMFYCMPQAESLYIDRYDVKAGHWPKNSNECILVLTSEGKISDYWMRQGSALMFLTTQCIWANRRIYFLGRCWMLPTEGSMSVFYWMDSLEA